MSKSPKLSRETKLHEECYTIAPLYEHSFLNKKKEFDLKLMLVYCSQKGIKPPTETITDFDTLHAKAKQTIVYININILNEKKIRCLKKQRDQKVLRPAAQLNQQVLRNQNKLIKPQSF